MADVGVLLDIDLHQELEVAGGRIDLRGDLRFGERGGDIVGLAEVALDLDEEGDHGCLRGGNISVAIQQNHAVLTRQGRARPSLTALGTVASLPAQAGNPVRMTGEMELRRSEPI